MPTMRASCSRTEHTTDDLATTATNLRATLPVEALGRWTDALAESTLQEVAERLQAGCEMVSLEEWMRRAKEAGYTMVVPRGEESPHARGPYINDLNPPRSWRALGCGFIEDATGRGFAHVDACRQTLPDLQRLRVDLVCLHRGRLIEA